MKEICTFVSDYYRDRRSSPSVNDIARAVGIAKTTAYRYLVDMNERGMISYDGHTIETPQINRCTSGYFSAPIVGSIRCGDPEAEEEFVEEYVSLPESVFHRFFTPNAFILGETARQIVFCDRSGSATTKLVFIGSSPRATHSTVA